MNSLAAIVLNEGLVLAFVSITGSATIGALGWFCACGFQRVLSIERRLTRLETKARLEDTDFKKRDL